MQSNESSNHPRLRIAASRSLSAYHDRLHATREHVPFGLGARRADEMTQSSETHGATAEALSDRLVGRWESLGEGAPGQASFEAFREAVAARNEFNLTETCRNFIETREAGAGTGSCPGSRQGRTALAAQLRVSCPARPRGSLRGSAYFFGKPASAFTSSICLVWRSEWAAMKRSHW